MNPIRTLQCLLLACGLAWPGADAAASRVDVISLTGPIGPVSVQHVSAAIARA
ncbi:MAG: hypothetical protein OXO51_18720 [Gemmatimonadota bacterium]|nr:hypothetical protein [Gemmatimonadota bacterium]